MFVGSFFDPPGNAARQAIIPDLAELTGIRLERANGAYVAIQASTQFVGIPLAGVLIATIGPSYVLWFDAASFFVSVAMVILLVPPIRSTYKKVLNMNGNVRQRYLSEVLNGLRFVLRERGMRAVILAGTAMSLFTPPLLGIVLPVYVERIFRSSVNLGLLLGTYSGGVIAGGLLYSLLASRLPRLPMLVLEPVGLAIGAVILATHPPLGAMLGAMAFAGLAAGPGPVLGTTLFQERTPANMCGSVFSIVIALSLAATPPGMLSAGFALEVAGLQATLLATAIGLMLISLALLTNRALRGIDQPFIDSDKGAGI